MTNDGILERRRRLTHRAAPAIGGLALVALLAGLVFGGRADSASERIAGRYAEAWERRDYAAMHLLLSPEARSRYDRAAFEEAHESAAATATLVALEAAEPTAEADGVVTVPTRVRTRVFGTIAAEVQLAISSEAVAWEPHMAFPGMTSGATLSRRTEVPDRGRIVSADGKVLAEGPAEARGSPVPEVAATIAGSLGPLDLEDEAARDALYARGFERDTPVGTSGLERAFEPRIAGRPGGELLAGARVLARTSPRPAAPIRTTIDTRVQEAADAALAGRLGGIAAIDTRTGAIEALAGIAFSAPQPPGSTFKIVTTAAALEKGAVKLSDEFPIESAAVIDGVELENANGELCGGDFANSFAHSCNSVFGPLGVEVGSEALVAAAERFGWNENPGIPGALPSTLPPAAEIVTPLEQASTAIGQYKTLATPLQLASVAQVIANRGLRIHPSLTPGARRTTRVTSPQIAATIGKLMVGVVDHGTGTLSQIEGVEVAGKTGTAELEDTRGDDPEAAARSGDPSNTDAWFTAYAPAGRPTIAVAAMFVRNGAGGTTAAPAAQSVLVAALKR